MTCVKKITYIEFLLGSPIASMLIIGQVNEFKPFTETGNFRLFPPPMMQIVKHECCAMQTTYNSVLRAL